MRKLRYNRIVSALVMGGLVYSTLPLPVAYAKNGAPSVSQPMKKPASPAGDSSGKKVAKAGGSATASTQVASAAGEGSPSETPSVEERKAPRTPTGAKVSFDFTDYDLNELIKRISEMTGKNFILTEPISGKKVTILSPTKITVEEAYQVFLSVLRSAGYTVVPLGRSLKVVPVANVSSEPVPTFTDDSGRTEDYVTRLFKVSNIDVEQIAGALGKLISQNGSVITYSPTNTLIITDTARNIDRILEIVQKLDVESPTEQLVIIPIRFAAATDISDKLMQVYGDEGQASAAGRGRTQPQNNRARNRKATPRQPQGPDSASFGEETPSISKIIADDRTNSLIVLATEKSLEDIKALVSKLDVDVDEAMKSDIHVVHLKYAKAEDLASTLASLAGSGGSAGRTGTTSRTNTNSRTNNNSRFNRSNTQSSSSGSQFGSAFSGGGSEVATFEGGVRVTADAPTNSLVITASYNDYQTLKRVIDRLDIRRKQVFVEAVILELSQDANKTVGVNYHGGVPGEDGAGTLFARGSQSLAPSDPNLLAGLAIGVFGALIDAPGALASGLAAATGADASTLQIPAFGVVLQALQQDKNVNILSTPSILTSNNQEAKIVVGQNIPFQSGSTISTIGSNISISREDVALTMKVTPQVNYSNEVTLQVFQEITEVVPGTSTNVLGPTTTKRSAETVVSVPDNQTVVIGGLIAAKENVAEDKVPVLGDIPLIGFLFRTKSKTISKSNLLIFLTPHIIDTEEDLHDVYRVKMLQRQEFIRRFYGKSREDQIKQLDDLIKYSMNLPDVPPVYPERVQTRPMESTIETTTRQRGFLAPIPGVDPNRQGTVVVPVLPEGDGEPSEGAPHGEEGAPHDEGASRLEPPPGDGGVPGPAEEGE